jgi:16S rRNA C967 or C1407 C5-methylase (RsmB/RsmF family)
VAFETTEKRERRWEEDLKIMGIGNWHTVGRDGKKWGRTELEG